MVAVAAILNIYEPISQPNGLQDVRKLGANLLEFKTAKGIGSLFFTYNLGDLLTYTDDPEPRDGDTPSAVVCSVEHISSIIFSSSLFLLLLLFLFALFLLHPFVKEVETCSRKH